MLWYSNAGSIIAGQHIFDKQKLSFLACQFDKRLTLKLLTKALWETSCSAHDAVVCSLKE